MYSHLHYDTVAYHKDHLHPACKFIRQRETDIKDQDKFQYYKNPENWNSILNLQLLTSSANESKNDKDLKAWIEEGNVDFDSQLIPKDCLDFDDFETFIETRRKMLATKLKEIVGA